VSLVLAPALCTPRRVDAATVTRAALVRSLVLGGAASLGLVALRAIGTSTGAEVAWRGPVGAVPLILAIALVLQAERLRALPWLIGGAAAILAGTTGVSVAQWAWALATAAGAVAVAALALLPWSTARARLNSHWPATARQA
jgi:hypothetical protein